MLSEWKQKGVPLGLRVTKLSRLPGILCMDTLENEHLSLDRL